MANSLSRWAVSVLSLHVDESGSVVGCLRKLAGGSMDYEALLPDAWRASNPESIRVYRDAECHGALQKGPPMGAFGPF